jgi:CheY-like chemotaxis protein
MSKPKRILVVEDEPIVALSLQDMLEDMGFDVIGPAFRVAAALHLAGSEAIDAAILDVNMAGEDSFPVAETLRARFIPFLFATGYGRQGLAPGFESSPVLQKPYRDSQVLAALRLLIG